MEIADKQVYDPFDYGAVKQYLKGIIRNVTDCDRLEKDLSRFPKAIKRVENCREFRISMFRWEMSKQRSKVLWVMGETGNYEVVIRHTILKGRPTIQALNGCSKVVRQFLQAMIADIRKGYALEKEDPITHAMMEGFLESHCRAIEEIDVAG